VAASTALPTSGTGTTSGVAKVAQTAAELIDSPRPSYPVLSLRRGEQGTAVVRIQIAVDGSVAGVELVESSGFTRLDDAALNGVRAWRFRPATRNGVAIASLFLHRLTFRIAAG
jgi:TonB family protein